MGRYGRHSIYVSTNPNVPVEVGIPGVSVFIGAPGPTIYNSGGNAPPSSGVMELIGASILTLIPSTAVLTLEF